MKWLKRFFKRSDARTRREEADKTIAQYFSHRGVNDSSINCARRICEEGPHDETNARWLSALDAYLEAAQQEA